MLDQWLTQAGAPAVRVLAGADLDLAVARGAAYYGYVRKGSGIRIRGGTRHGLLRGRRERDARGARHAAAPAGGVRRAVRPRGGHARAELPTPSSAWWWVSRCAFASSAPRCGATTARASVLERWSDDELVELQEIEASLPAEGHAPGEVVTVQLQAGVTEVGTLELEAVARGGAQRWKVELDTRAAA